jgi:hypothetical protein
LDVPLRTSGLRLGPNEEPRGAGRMTPVDPSALALAARKQPATTHGHALATVEFVPSSAKWSLHLVFPHPARAHFSPAKLLTVKTASRQEQNHRREVTVHGTDLMSGCQRPWSSGMSNSG